MAKFIITATPCEYQHRCNGVTTMSCMLMTKPLAEDIAICRTPAEVGRALLDMRDRVRTAYAGSFFVSHRLARGERAPAGYRQMAYRLDCEAETPRPKVGDTSPWGVIDHATPLGPHAVSVSTPSHGGIWVTTEGLGMIPQGWRELPYSKGQWFEEDCDWCIPYLWCGLGEFEPTDERRAEVDAVARMTMKHCHPDCWEIFEVADALASEVRKAG